MGKKDAPEEHSKANVEFLVSALCFLFCLGAACCGRLYADGPAWARKMCSLQYANKDGTFGGGPDDLYGVIFAAALLTVLRKAFQDVVFAPIATLMQIDKASDRIKFRQNGWVFVYYLSSFTWGLFEIYGCEYWFNTQALWTGYPQNSAMQSGFKLYLGFQTAFWFHMVFVTLVEPWQKDFVVMILHHFVTITMIVGSYYLGMVRVAHAILVEQDFADILLPAAKMCNYVALGNSPLKGTFQAVADGLFAVFALVWIPTRHVILPIIYYSLWTEAEKLYVGAGCDCGRGTECVLSPERGCTLSAETFGTAVRAYLIFLGFFQCLLAFWLKELLVAVYKALAGGSVKGVEESSAQNTPELDKKES